MKTNNKIKVGDIIGNQGLGFRFQVMEIIFKMDFFYTMKVENISTFEKFVVTSDVMNKK